MTTATKTKSTNHLKAKRKRVAPKEAPATTSATNKPPVKKAPAKRSGTSRPKSVFAGKLTELNPYDKKLFPKHHKVAQMLLTGKPVRWAVVHEATGAGNRTLGVVKKHLTDCGVTLDRKRNEDREIVYTASAPKSARRKEAAPLAQA